MKTRDFYTSAFFVESFALLIFTIMILSTFSMCIMSSLTASVSGGNPDTFSEMLQSDSDPMQTDLSAHNENIACDRGNSDSAQQHTQRPQYSVSAAPVAVTLLTPNGGETLQADEFYNITWTASGGVGTLNITLRYTFDGLGGAWNLIAAKIPNTGYYNWKVPNKPSINCFVNITAEDQNTPMDADTDNSDSKFTVLAPPITVQIIYPNGGQNLTAGKSTNIHWKITGGYGTKYTTANFSTDNGTHWNPIAADVTSNYTTWNVPDIGATSMQCLILLFVRDNSPSEIVRTGTDTSNATFIIYVPPILPIEITILSPSGGDICPVGSVQSITWSVSGGKPPYSPAKVEYSLDGKNGTYRLVADSITTPTYSWSIPYLPFGSTDVFIRITLNDSKGTVASGTNDAPFTITVPDPPNLTITTPNGGEFFGAGTTRRIEWTVSGGVEPLRITLKYSVSGSSGPFTDIAININASAMGFEWVVPSLPSTQCYIYANLTDSYAGGPRYSEDISDSAFSIIEMPNPPAVEVLQPSFGLRWSVDHTYKIMWIRTGGGNPFRTTIEYSTDNKNTWFLVTNNATDTGGTNSHDWIVPNKPSNQCYVRISVWDKYGQEAIGYSAQFTITTEKPPEFGNLEGTVTDDRNRPLAGAQVTVVEKPEFKAVTDGTGYFIIRNISVGVYSIRINLNDYYEIKTDAIYEVIKDTTTNIGTFVMRKAPPPPMPLWMTVLMAMVVLIIVFGIAVGVISRYRRRQKESEEKPKAVWVNINRQQAFGQGRQHRDATHTTIGAVSGTHRGTLSSQPRYQTYEDMSGINREEELKNLKELREKGLISDEEYEFSTGRLRNAGYGQTEKSETAKYSSGTARGGSTTLANGKSGVISIPTGARQVPPPPPPGRKKMKKKSRSGKTPAPGTYMQTPTAPKPPEKTVKSGADEPSELIKSTTGVADDDVDDENLTEEQLVERALKKAEQKRRSRATADSAGGELDILTLNELLKLEERKRAGELSEEEYSTRRKELLGK